MKKTPNDFLKLSDQDAIKFVSERKRPKCGVFIPNGTRRLVLTEMPYPSQLEEYKKSYVDLSKKRSFDVLKIFFKYGIEYLVIPLFSYSALKRGSWYKNIVNDIIKTLFSDPLYLEFYSDNSIAVKVYGNPEALIDLSISDSLEIITRCVEQTANGTKNVFFGIGGVDEMGINLMNWGIDFYKKYNKFPTVIDQKEHYYGKIVPEADFVITSSSLKAHSLPPLICGRSTNLYYLPVPSLLGLNEISYRKILYDLVAMRKNVEIDFSNLEFDPLEIKKLNDAYAKESNKVLGIGESVGPFWVLKTN